MLLLRSLPWLCLLAIVAPATAAEQYFAIQVVDEETGRGIPMIEVKIVPDHAYITDSAGWVAISDPTLMNQDVFFLIQGQGYQYKQDQFHYPGRAVRVKPGGSATFKMHRNIIAQRVYRQTGIGIYRDSVMLSKPVPIKKPLVNSLVTGQDSVETAVAGDTIYWFWGDTDRLAYPLGNFGTTGARSKLPEAGGLNPDQGVNLEYYTGKDGFVEPMFPNVGGLATWIGGLFTIKDAQGKERILTQASLRKGLGDVVESKLCVLDPEKPGFDTLVVYDHTTRLWPRGKAFRATTDGVEYIYFATPYPTVRVPARWEAVLDSTQYEAFTPLKAGTHNYSEEDPGKNEKGEPIPPKALEPKDLQLDWTPNHRLNWAWKKNTGVLNRNESQALVDARLCSFEDNYLRTIDAQSGKELQLASGSVYWNPYRQRYVMIVLQGFGDPSYLGEIWYSEAKEPHGPFSKAVKIVSHWKYSFYNPLHHHYFDQDGGKTIFFEATLSTLFTENVPAIPFYDYNQVMYKLDLSDERLKPAHAE